MTAYLGIDIAKLKFDVELLNNDKFKSHKFVNNLKGFKELLSWLKKQKVDDIRICMEATGSYGDAVAHFLFDEGIYVSVVNPAQIKAFAQTQLTRNKTDQADAKLIARYACLHQPALWKPQPKHIRELQAWVRRLEALQGLLQQEQNRLDTASPVVIPSIKVVIKTLTKEIEVVRKHIRDHIDQHPDLRGKRDLLDTIPGIGEATIAQLLTEFAEPSRFTNAKAAAAFTGITPKQHQSGSSVKGKTRISKTGSSRLRKALYMPALVALRYNPIIKAFAARLTVRGKSKMAIICAAMRKLIHIAYGVLKTGKPFDPTLA